MKSISYLLSSAIGALIFAISSFSPVYAKKNPPHANGKATGSFQITFNNQSSNPSIKHVYLVLKGNNADGKTCFVRMVGLKSPTDQTVSQCEPLTPTTKPADYAFDAVNNVTFRVPFLESGRIYISINKPLIMHINYDPDKPDVITLAEPSVYDSNPISNPDYNTMFDKVEFTYTPEGNTFFNPTAVDFLSLPISIAQGPNVFGLTMDRESAFAEIQHTFSEERTIPHQYDRLLIQNGDVKLRILAPGRDANSFDENYLNPYIDWLFNEYYYSNDGVTVPHTLKIQLVEAGGVVPGSPNILSNDEGIFTGFVKTMDSEKAFVFTNSLGDVITIKRSSMMSNSLFEAAMAGMDVTLGATTRARLASMVKPSDLQATLDSLSANYKAVIVKFIACTWASGLLPIPEGDVVTQQYIRDKIGSDVTKIYKEHAMLPSDLKGHGPWYQLYGKAIHLLTPHLYAFPYDDVFGLDGTNALNDSYPAVVTLHGMKDTVVPPPAAN